MDNARYHTSEEIKIFLKIQAFTTYFIPAYAPSLTPIELYFGDIKAKVGQIMISKFLEHQILSELDVLVRSIKDGWKCY